jgi:hypothetical protein
MKILKRLARGFFYSNARYAIYPILVGIIGDVWYSINNYFANESKLETAPEYIDNLDIIGWIEHYRYIFAFAIALWLTFTILRLRGISKSGKDEQRLYDAKQKQQVIINCGAKCEHRMFFIFRCNYGATEAAHVYSHALGAPTTIKNSFGLCKSHCTQKSSRRPSPYLIFCLNFWRRFYDPRFKNGNKSAALPYTMDLRKLADNAENWQILGNLNSLPANEW